MAPGDFPRREPGVAVEPRLANGAVNAVVAATTIRVLAALEDAAVAAVTLKGPLTAEWLYGDTASRQSTDVDVLVAPGDLARAAEVLTALGYEPFDLSTPGAEPRHAVSWLRRDSPVAVDVHRTVVGARAAAEVVWQVFSAGSERVPLGAAAVPVPSPDVRLAHLVLHAAQHGAGDRRGIADVRRALEVFGRDEWTRAAGVARRLDAVDAFVAGLGLVPEGRILLARLGLPERPAAIDATLRARTPPHLAVGVQLLTELPGMAPRWAFVRGKAIPPAEFMRAWSPLARKGRLGLVAAYGWRLVWLGRHLPSAVVAVARARGAARSRT